jgi:hypothetical protein
LLEEAAIQMSSLIQQQEAEHPDVQFHLYQVGDKLQVPTAQIEENSPLYRWLHG